jgi:ketosteroid isomerase-like protein
VAQRKLKPQPNAHHSEVHQLLSRYAQALVTGDVPAVARMWAVPSIVISGDGVHAVSTRDEIEAFFADAKAQYNQRGIFDTYPDIQTEDWIGEKLVVVQVRWPWLDAAGEEKSAEASDYTLRRNDKGELQIVCVVMRGVLP